MMAREVPTDSLIEGLCRTPESVPAVELLSTLHPDLSLSPHFPRPRFVLRLLLKARIKSGSAVCTLVSCHLVLS